jgi:hypothetical protein
VPGYKVHQTPKLISVVSHSIEMLSLYFVNIPQIKNSYRSKILTAEDIINKRAEFASEPGGHRGVESLFLSEVDTRRWDIAFENFFVSNL